jgi:tetratricopeptide (TPR) repeat protein
MRGDFQRDDGRRALSGPCLSENTELKRLYTQEEVSRLIGVSESQIRYWDQTGLIPRTEKQRGRLLFDFKALVAFRTVRELLNRGVSTRKIRKCVERLKERMPEIRHPLTEVRMAIYGGEVVFGKDSLTFTPEGQILIDFSPPKESPIPLPIKSEEDLFFQALECEQIQDWKEAEKRYEWVLQKNPGHADALVNLGNVRHRAGLPKEAEIHYRRALLSDPDHVEANYNLANLFEERGDLENAILFYHKSISGDPEFADAHFNLAMVLERRGDREEAKKHWRIYLDLDPTSQWAEYAHKRLGDDHPISPNPPEG